MFFVYAIKNENNNIYIGQTDNLEERIKRHNGILKNKIKSYTSKNYCGEWKIIYQEIFKTRREAMSREKQLKSYQGRQFIKNLIQ